MPDRWGSRFLPTFILSVAVLYGQQPATGPVAGPAKPARKAEGSADTPADDIPAAGPKPPANAAGDSVSQEDRRSLNLLGQADTAGGEAPRNQNRSINLVNNNAAQEVNARLGMTATIVEQFLPANRYFGSEFGNAPQRPIYVTPQSGVGTHGNLYWTHQNSIFKARSFFQVGGVKPAHDNVYGGTLGTALWRGAFLNITGSQDKNRGQVNGNILIPLPSERTPLTMDPKLYAIVQNILDGYPDLTPNRTDINIRATNLNAPQLINTDTGSGQITQHLGDRDQLVLRYNYTGQRVDAFQFVRGMNPNTRTKSHGARITWNHTWTPNTILNLTAGFDRQRAQLLAAPGTLGTIPVTGLQRQGPFPQVPFNRTQNMFRYETSVQKVTGNHTLSAGASLMRLQYNGEEPDGALGITQFRPDFGRDAITNLRMGTPSSYIQAIGTTYRGFRNFQMAAYVGDIWKATSALTIDYGVRWEGFTLPVDVTGRSHLNFHSDLNNFGPRFGFAYRLPGRWGVLRSAYGTMFGQIYPGTYGQDRLNLPYLLRVNVPAPNLVDPLQGISTTINPNEPSTVYEVSKDLSTPYSHQYNFSWEFDVKPQWHIQLGYVGSRSIKLFNAWSLNRAQPVPGIPLISNTINERRPNPNEYEHLLILNTSVAYYDAARVSFSRPNWHGLSLNASYWFSKAMDLGTTYTGTASGSEARQANGQDGINVSKDLKARSNFDQPHSFLLQASYDTGRGAGGFLRGLTRGWSLATVYLLKSGTPFTVQSGSDGLNVGNLDGVNQDRPVLLDPSILGQIVGNPDTSAQLLPASAFRFINAPQELAGNLGRNTFRKGKIANMNASLSRTFTLPHDWNMTFRAESVNFFNTPQFDQPGRNLASANFGKINNTLNDGRTFRFTLRLAF